MSRFLSPGTMTILILAILVGLVAAYAIRNTLGPRVPTMPQQPAATHVPLAAADLPAGRTIVLDDLALFPMTRQQMDEQPWGKSLLTVMLNPEQIIGRTLQNRVQHGQPIMTSDLYLRGTGPSLLELLRPGYRAISIQVPFERGGYVSLGSNVDVIFRSTFRPGGDTAAPVPEKTIVLVESAEVIAVEKAIPPPASASSGLNPPQAPRNLDLRLSNTNPDQAEQSPTIVIAVTPEQANKIEAVRNHGEFTLISRPPNETNYGGPPPPTSLEDVLGIQTLLSAEPLLPAMTEIYRRGQRQVNVFQAMGGRYYPASSSPNPRAP